MNKTILIISLLIIFTSLLIHTPEHKKEAPSDSLCSNMMHKQLSEEAASLGCNVKEIMKKELEIKKLNKFN